MNARQKLLAIIGAGGVATGVALQAQDAQAYQIAVDQGTPEALEAFIQIHPTSALAPEAFKTLLATVQHNNGTGRASPQGKANNHNNGHGNGTYGG